MKSMFWARPRRDELARAAYLCAARSRGSRAPFFIVAGVVIGVIVCAVAAVAVAADASTGPPRDGSADSR